MKKWKNDYFLPPNRNLEDISGRENFLKNEVEHGCWTTASSSLSTTVESAKANAGVAEVADT